MSLIWDLVKLLFQKSPVARVRPVDPERLRRHVEELALGIGARDLAHLDGLERAADYIQQEFGASAGTVSDQPFRVRGQTVRNIRCRFGPDDGPALVVGAHYDSFGGFPGADDNASGVAGLLELARLVSRERLAAPVELVAYTLEEPPHFGTEEMGSRFHARDLSGRRVPIKAMIGLEMIGFFSDEVGSQEYPVPGMALLYPGRGNFIAVVGRTVEPTLVETVRRAMVLVDGIEVESLSAPASLAGVGLSDHASYWQEGIPAVMVTDTAFFRNPHYHTENDLPASLDYVRMARVVSGVHQAVLSLTGS